MCISTSTHHDVSLHSCARAYHLLTRERAGACVSAPQGRYHHGNMEESLNEC